MPQENKVLYWFRDNLEIAGNHSLFNALSTCSAFIPVFCFDPREPVFFSDKSAEYDYKANLIEKVSNLRTLLQNRGSNLLIVNDYYERIIPSLARVLMVNEVLTDEIRISSTIVNQQISNHRLEKTKEIFHLLNMHSIIVKTAINKVGDHIPDIFPCFPDINSGNMPSLFEKVQPVDGAFLSASN